MTKDNRFSLSRGAVVGIFALMLDRALFRHRFRRSSWSTGTRGLMLVGFFFGGGALYFPTFLRHPQRLLPALVRVLQVDCIFLDGGYGLLCRLGFARRQSFPLTLWGEGEVRHLREGLQYVWKRKLVPALCRLLGARIDML